MSFLSPVFLWLLPLAVVPLIIYLYNKNKFKSVKFSSLKFLKFIDNKSIKKINIINIILLILRILILILIVIMISRPVLSELQNTSGKKSDSLILIFVDNSFSMSSEIKEPDFKDAIRNIIHLYDDNSLLIIRSLNNNYEFFNSLKREFDLSNLIIPVSYDRNDYSKTLSFIENNTYSEYLNKYLFYITDMQENETVNSISSIDDSWNVNFIKLNNNNNNAGISNVSSSMFLTTLNFGVILGS